MKDQSELIKAIVIPLTIAATIAQLWLYKEIIQLKVDVAVLHERTAHK